MINNEKHSDGRSVPDPKVLKNEDIIMTPIEPGEVVTMLVYLMEGETLRYTKGLLYAAACPHVRAKIHRRLVERLDEHRKAGIGAEILIFTGVYGVG